MGEIIVASAVIVCAGLAYSVANRALAIWEQSVTTRLLPSVTPKLGPMPADLRMMCERPQAEWARDDTRRHIEELAAEHQDWDTVRSVLMAEGLNG